MKFGMAARHLEEGAIFTAFLWFYLVQLAFEVVAAI